MATTAGDIYVRSGASGSFTSVQYVQGGWITVDSGSDMTSLYHDRLKDGQIILVQSSSEAYKVKKFVAFSTPGYGGSDDSASFHSFNFPGAGGGGASAYSDLTGIPGSIVSSSNQIGSSISGSFTLASASLASSIVSNTTNISTNTTEINVLSAATSSYAVTSTAALKSEVSGAFAVASSSLASRIASNDTDIATNTTEINVISATTSSYLLNNANQTLSGDLVITGDLTAQKFNTELVSSSVIFESGSTIFGNSADDTHDFSGSLRVSGSIDAKDFSTSLGTKISGSFAVASSSLASRIASNDTDIATNLTEINVLSAATSSYAVSSTAALKTGISGSFTVTSASLAAAIATNTTTGTSNALNITTLNNKTLFSGSAQVTGLLTSSITNFNTKVSESVAKQGFGSGGGASAYSDLTGIPGGIVSASAQITGLSTGSITDFNTKVSQSVAKQGFGSGGGGGDITSVTAGQGLSGGGVSGAVTLNMDTGSNHFARGVLQEITPGLSVTGSLKALYDGFNDPFSIISASITRFSIDHRGVLNLATQSSTPTVTEGGLYLDTNHDLFIGQ